MVAKKLKLALASAAAILALATAAGADGNVTLFDFDGDGNGSFASGDFVAENHSGGSGDWKFHVTYAGKGAGQITLQLYAPEASAVDVDDLGGPDLCRPAVTAGSGTGTVKGSRDVTVAATGSVSCIRATSSEKKGTFTVTLVSHP